LQGIDVIYAREEGWQHYADKDILSNAHAMHRYVLTHDSDFGNWLCIGNNPLLESFIYTQADERLLK